MQASNFGGTFDQLFLRIFLLGRASSEPHSYVLTWLSVTIYIYIGIDRPAAVFDPAPGVKVSLL